MAPSNASKARADLLLVARGLAETRSRAQALIMAGKAYCGTRRIEKSGDMLAADAALTLRAPDHPWVGRGGIKLAHGLSHFSIDVRDRVALDIGASTGGFTDVILTQGGRKVYAVDVGHGQLAWKLRQDPRVVVLERLNARYLTRTEIDEAPNLIVCDASFISLRVVLPAALALAARGAVLLALIKPQFEVGKGLVGKKGVVRDPDLRAQVCDEVVEWLQDQAGWSVLGVTESPITGPEGNVEYLIAASLENASTNLSD